MKIKTKHNVGDEVWYFLDRNETAGFGKGKIVEIDVKCKDYGYLVKCVIKNKYQKRVPDDYFPMPYYNNWRYQSSFTYYEQEVFKSLDLLKKYVKKNRNDFFLSLKELK